MPPRTRRTRGSIGQLPSGSYRVTVYAGTDPLTGKMRQLRRTVKTYDEARKELTSSSARSTRTSPKSDITVRQAIEQWLDVAALEAELGIDREPRRLISVDWAPNDREGDKILFVFDCGNLGPDEDRLSLPADESDRWEWVDIAQLGEHVIDRIAHRVRAAVERPSVAYLEHGRPTAPTLSP
jgi:hypothetical protein